MISLSDKDRTGRPAIFAIQCPPDLPGTLIDDVICIANEAKIRNFV